MISRRELLAEGSQVCCKKKCQAACIQTFALVPRSGVRSRGAWQRLGGGRTHPDGGTSLGMMMAGGMGNGDGKEEILMVLRMETNGKMKVRDNVTRLVTRTMSSGKAGVGVRGGFLGMTER